MGVLVVKCLFHTIILIQIFWIGSVISQDAVATTNFNVNRLDVNGYHFGFRTSNGIRRTETGTFADSTLRVMGEYSYEVDGRVVTVTYTADERGFRPTFTWTPVLNNFRIGPRISGAALASLTGGGIG